MWERFALKTFSTHLIRVAYGIGIKYGDEVTLASHFYMIAIKNPLEGVGWSLCELSHPLVDFVEIRD